MRTRIIAVALAAAGTALLSAAPGAAQETGTFVLSQNGNQIATEEFTRTSDQLETQLEITGQGILATVSTLNDDATVTRMELRVFPPGNPDADPVQSTAAEFGSDSVHVEQPIGTESGAGAAVAGTVPYLNPSPSYMEQILRRARAIGGTQVTVQIWVPGQGAAGQVVPVQVEFTGESSATLALGAATVEIETDGDGRLMAGEVPSQSLVIERQ